MVLRTLCVIESHMRAIHSDDFDQINEKLQVLIDPLGDALLV